VTSLEGLTEAHLDAFAKTNAVFNAWPYWREFVQSTTVRMGLPPLVTPVFRFPTQPPPTPGPDTSDQATATD
jgi:preprotein translocase subunit SecB